MCTCRHVCVSWIFEGCRCSDVVRGTESCSGVGAVKERRGKNQDGSRRQASNSGTDLIISLPTVESSAAKIAP